LHAFTTGKRVLDGYGQSVADVEVTGDIGWGEAYDKFVGVFGVDIGFEELTK
jgi:hypothetical protein